MTLGKTLKLSPSFIKMRRITLTTLLHQEDGVNFCETHKVGLTLIFTNFS